MCITSNLFWLYAQHDRSKQSLNDLPLLCGDLGCQIDVCSKCAAGGWHKAQCSIIRAQKSLIYSIARLPAHARMDRRLTCNLLWYVRRCIDASSATSACHAYCEPALRAVRIGSLPLVQRQKHGGDTLMRSAQDKGAEQLPPPPPPFGRALLPRRGGGVEGTLLYSRHARTHAPTSADEATLGPTSFYSASLCPLS